MNLETGIFETEQNGRIVYYYVKNGKVHGPYTSRYKAKKALDLNDWHEKMKKTKKLEALK